jgi:hypothetical protein
MTITIVTGLACSGKTTAAEDFAKNVITCDDFRFGEAWIKRDKSDYMEDVLGAVNVHVAKNEDVVVEGIYFDAHDPSNARSELFHSLLETHKDCVVVIISPVQLKIQVARLIDRSILRYAKQTREGSCPEKSHNRAAMVMKNIENYDACVKELDMFKNYVIMAKFTVRQLILDFDVIPGISQP